jgi:pyruvate dehydrogenase E2 component (dihydrolipoamide acetyltransferase)
VVEELVVSPGEKVPVGTLLARLRPQDGTPAEAGRERVAGPREPPREAPVPAPPSAPARAAAARLPPVARRAARPPAPGEAVGPLRASPAARRRAQELGIDLAAVTGRGPGGAVTLADVDRAAAAAPSPPHRLHVHPVARRIAGELGVDLATVRGTGAGGAVTKADVLAAAAARPAADRAGEPREVAAVTPPVPTPTATAALPATGLRRALAAAMERANREIPHYYLTTEIDLARSMAWLASANAQRPPAERLLPAALLLKATALALLEVPELNGFWVDGAFRPGPGIHLGVAVSRKGGEVVIPALHHVDRLSLAELMAALADLVRRARAGALRSSEVADATLTVTNLGELGVDSVLGVIYPPQVALVGFGRIRERPWAEGGMLAVRPLVVASLAADHRASDGYRGSRFLAALAARLQRPEEL